MRTVDFDVWQFPDGRLLVIKSNPEFKGLAPFSLFDDEGAVSAAFLGTVAGDTKVGAFASWIERYPEDMPRAPEPFNYAADADRQGKLIGGYIMLAAMMIVGALAAVWLYQTFN